MRINMLLTNSSVCVFFLVAVPVWGCCLFSVLETIVLTLYTDLCTDPFTNVCVSVFPRMSCTVSYGYEIVL